MKKSIFFRPFELNENWLCCNNGWRHRNYRFRKTFFSTWRKLLNIPRYPRYSYIFREKTRWFESVQVIFHEKFVKIHFFLNEIKCKAAIFIISLSLSCHSLHTKSWPPRVQLYCVANATTTTTPTKKSELAIFEALNIEVIQIGTITHSLLFSFFFFFWLDTFNCTHFVLRKWWFSRHLVVSHKTSQVFCCCSYIRTNDVALMKWVFSYEIHWCNMK